MKRLTTLSSSFLLSALVLFAQDAAPEASAAAEDTLNLWGLIQQGGWAMYPLGTCSLIMFFLIFYSWKETTPNKFFTAEQLKDDQRRTGEREHRARAPAPTRWQQPPSARSLPRAQKDP